MKISLLRNAPCLAGLLFVVAAVPCYAGPYAPPGSTFSGPVGPTGSPEEVARQGRLAYGSTLTQPVATTWAAVLSKGYTDGKAWGVSRKFRPVDRTIYCAVEFNGLYSGTLQFVWVAESVRDPSGALAINPRNRGRRYYKNARIAEAKTEGDFDSASGHMKLPHNWPKGRYRVELYASGRLLERLPFTIR